MPLQVRTGDVGAVIRLTIQRDGVAVDISAASTKQIKVYDRSGVLAATLTGSFLTNGTDGILQATTTSDCFTVAGQWRAVAYLVLGAWTGHSATVTIEAVDVAKP
jgi:hypothetical protein